jgi:hypothetical protein
MRLELSRNGGGMIPLWGMHIDTPGRRETEQRVDEFFEEKSSMLTFEEVNRGAKIFCVAVRLHEMDGLAPPSHFLDGLCSFLRERAFVIDYTCPELNLYISVSDDVVERSDAIIAEATSKICLAFLENESFLDAHSLSINVPATPSQDVVDRFLLVQQAHPNPGMVLRVSDLPTRPGVSREVLEFHIEGARLVAEGEAHAVAFADRVLETETEYEPSRGAAPVLVMLSSPRIAAAVTASLRRNPGHPYRAFYLVASGDASPRSGALGSGITENWALDGADLLPALLRCPSVSNLIFQEFRFSSDTVEAAHDATATSAAALSTLRMSRCNFVESDFGLVDLASAASRSSTLRSLHFANSPITMRDMRTLCDMLTGSEWSIKELTLVDTEADEAGLDDDCVQYFFQHLPSMNTLECLLFSYKVPTFMSRRISEGIKNNYSLDYFGGLVYASDPESGVSLEHELEACVSANARGRRMVHEAVAHPENRELQEAALAVLHRLANSGDPEDESVLFLCLQLVLPARANKSTPPSPLPRG